MSKASSAVARVTQQWHVQYVVWANSSTVFDRLLQKTPEVNMSSDSTTS